MAEKTSEDLRQQMLRLDDAQRAWPARGTVVALWRSIWQWRRLHRQPDCEGAMMWAIESQYGNYLADKEAGDGVWHKC